MSSDGKPGSRRGGSMSNPDEIPSLAPFSETAEMPDAATLKRANRRLYYSFCVMPYAVSAYHVACMVGSLAVSWRVGVAAEHSIVHDTVVYSLCAGLLGGTLHSSRFVVYAVRHRTYDPNRCLWQILTPIHSAIFSLIALGILLGGLVPLAKDVGGVNEPRFALFVIGFSFMIGFASEVFVKRLIKATEALLGEHGDLGPEGPSQRTNPRKHASE